MLTWLNQEGLVFDAKTLKQKGTFSYTGEGWGITNDGRYLYMSNGTSLVTVLDPTSWTVVRTIAVTLDGMVRQGRENIAEHRKCNGCDGSYRDFATE
jgi:glutamine cyclotransferase